MPERLLDEKILQHEQDTNQVVPEILTILIGPFLKQWIGIRIR